MRDYGKVHSTFWSSPTIAELSDDGRLLALYLMTCSHNTIAGLFRLPDGYVAEDLRWEVERVRQGFAELSAKGFANRCETTKWVWIVKHLNWNPPENPNQRKAAVKVARSTPDACSWKQDFARVCGPLLGLGAQAEPNGSGTVPKPFRNQEQEQEQKAGTGVQGAIAPLVPASPAPAPEDLEGHADAIPPCPVKKLVAMFTAKVPELPKPRYEMWKESAGADAMRQRWKWLLNPETKRDDGSRYAESADQGLEWFGKFFDVVAGSDFLTGRSGDWAKCSLEWLMKRENFMKVVQGNYDNRTQRIAA